MSKKLVFALAAALAANTGWAASAASSSPAGSKEEHIGVGAGAGIGALAGPVGLVVGAALGAWLGDRFHEEVASREAVELELGEARQTVEALTRSLDGSERQLTSIKEQLVAERETQRTALERALDIEVLFKTEASEVDPASAEHLARLGEVLAPLSDVVVTLDGHADVRGEARYNQALSAERARAVKDILVAAGMPEDRVVVSAEGESGARAAPDDVDGLALDRRVHLSVYTERDDRVARQ